MIKTASDNNSYSIEDVEILNKIPISKLPFNLKERKMPLYTELANTSEYSHSDLSP